MTEVSTYSGADVAPLIEGGLVVTKPVILMPTASSEVTNIVKYVENLPEVSVKKIQTVTSQETETVFGNGIITVEGVTGQNNQIVFTVNYNTDTGDIVLNNFIKLNFLNINSKTFI